MRGGSGDGDVQLSVRGHGPTEVYSNDTNRLSLRFVDGHRGPLSDIITLTYLSTVMLAFSSLPLDKGAMRTSGLVYVVLYESE